MLRLGPGTLLVASPMLGDPNFARAAVWILEHGDGGTMGLIINRPLTLPLREIWDAVPAALAPATLAADGGPVERGKGILLHGDPALPDCQQIGDGLAVGGTLTALARRWQSGADHAGPRLFLGHSGWSHGQLDRELEEGAWMLRRGRPEWLLTAPPDTLWERLVHGQGFEPEPVLN